MSKASDWAAALSRATNDRPPRMMSSLSENSPLGAGVTDNGRAVITHGATTIWLESDAFLALCRWGLETFGESA